MCIWQESKKISNCVGCPLYDIEHIQDCDEFEDTQDIVNLIDVLEKMLDKLDEDWYNNNKKWG